jgi:hypothetical protein
MYALNIVNLLCGSVGDAEASILPVLCAPLLAVS